MPNDLISNYSKNDIKEKESNEKTSDVSLNKTGDIISNENITARQDAVDAYEEIFPKGELVQQAIFPEKTDIGKNAEGADGFCGRRDGGGLLLEPAAACTGQLCCHGIAGVPAGCRRFPGGRGLPAVAGCDHTPYAYGQAERRTAKRV